MDIRNAIANTIDSGIGLFDPLAQVKRMRARQAVRSLSTQYAAAKTTKQTGDWRPADSSINDIIKNSSTLVRARAEQLVRDFPYFKRATSVIINHTVGTGIGYQSQIRESKDSNTLDTKINNMIEDAWKYWQDEADVAGKLHFVEMMRLLKREETTTGEFILVKRFVKDPNRISPFALQAYDARWFATYGADVTGKNLFDQGIETDRGTGKVVAYHFEDPDNFKKAIKVPADLIVHGFETTKPGQLRGISEFASAIIVAHSLADYMDAEIDGAKMAAKWLAFIQCDDPVAQSMVESEVNPNNTDQRIETLENGIIQYLQKGEKVDMDSANRPGSSFGPFTQLILRMIAVSVDISYELLSGDYNRISFSNHRGIRNDMNQAFKPKQWRFIRQVVKPSFAGFLQGAVLTGKLKLPGFFDDPTPYFRGTWMPPGRSTSDPLREAKANETRLKGGLTSPQKILADTGDNIEDVYTDLVAAKDLADHLGLEFGESSTALANNPAALDPDLEEETDA